MKKILQTGVKKIEQGLSMAGSGKNCYNEAIRNEMIYAAYDLNINEAERSKGMLRIKNSVQLI